VQGPPGTGKTHTIGNLVGHLLAQGKSVLVTSHTTKALRMVLINRSELRPCVSACSKRLGQPKTARERRGVDSKGYRERCWLARNAGKKLESERLDLLKKLEEIRNS